jgi:hypothetical protein
MWIYTSTPQHALKYEILGGWKGLHNEELHNICSSPDDQVKEVKIRHNKHETEEKFI